MYAHLRCCESCFETYQYTLRVLAAVPGEEPVVPATSAEAARIAARRARVREARVAARRRIWSQPVGRFVLLPLCVLAFSAIVWWLRPIGTTARFDPDTAILRPITDAMISASARQALVLPGVERRLVSTSAQVSAASAGRTGDVGRSLGVLKEKLQRGDISRDELEWLVAGSLANGARDDARSILGRARRSYPGDWAFTHLAAVLAFEDHQLDSARDMLVAVEKQNPGDAGVAYNLAQVLRALGDDDAALDRYQRVAGSGDGALADRAFTAISEMSRKR